MAPRHGLDRRAFLVALAAVPFAPVMLAKVAAPAMVDRATGISIRFIQYFDEEVDWRWEAAPSVQLAFHPDAFVMVMRDLPPARLPLQRFDPARLPA